MQTEIKIDQISLVAAIVKEINDQHDGKLTADHELFNTCIEVANLCKEKLDGTSVDTVNQSEKS
jgi:hypothetical protein